MWEVNYKESWAQKNWCFWTVVLEKTLESPLECKEIQPVHPKEDQSWVFTGRTDVEAETPILWPPDAKCWLTGKVPDAGKDWGQEEKVMTYDEMIGWQWTWVWVDSRSWWWTGRPGVLRFMGSQRVRHDRATELNWSDFGGKSCYSQPLWHTFCQPFWCQDTNLQGLRSLKDQHSKNKSHGEESQFETYRVIANFSEILPNIRQVKLLPENFVLMGAECI